MTWCGPWTAAARPVHEERLVRLERLVLAQPVDRVVGEVFAQVVALVPASCGGSDAGGVAHQARLVLRRFAGEEAVEVLEAVAGRPVVERAGGGRLLGGRVVPLAERRGAVAVVLQHLGHSGAALRDDAGVAVPVVGQLGDLPVADAVMVAARQQRRAGRRTHRRGVEAVVGDASP